MRLERIQLQLRDFERAMSSIYDVEKNVAVYAYVKSRYPFL